MTTKTTKHKVTVGEKVGRLGVQFDRLRKEFDEFVEKASMSVANKPMPPVPAEAYLPKILGYIVRDGVEALRSYQPIRIYPCVQAYVEMVPVCLLSAAQDAINEALAGEHPVPDEPTTKPNGVTVENKDGKKVLLPMDENLWPWKTFESPYRTVAVIARVRIAISHARKFDPFLYRVTVPSTLLDGMKWSIRGGKPNLKEAKRASVAAVMKHFMEGQQDRTEVRDRACPLPPKQEQWNWEHDSGFAAFQMAYATMWKVSIERLNNKNWFGLVHIGITVPMTCVISEEIPASTSEAEVKQIMVDKARTLWFDRMSHGPSARCPL